MIVDLARCRRIVKPTCKAMGDREREINPADLCGRAALATSCHIVAVAYYMAELYGMTPRLQAFIDLHVDFYHITEVQNQEAFYEQAK